MRNGGKEKFQLIKEKKRGKINGKRLADSARSAERMINMKRVFIPLWKALKDAREMYDYPNDWGMMACYDVENMGFCKDGKTRWYHFTSVDGVPAYTLKH